MGAGGLGSRRSSALACCGQWPGHLAPQGVDVVTHKIWCLAQVGPEALLSERAPRPTEDTI